MKENQYDKINIKQQRGGGLGHGHGPCSRVWLIYLLWKKIIFSFPTVYNRQ